VGFVDGDEAWFAPSEHLGEAGDAHALGGDEEELEGAVEVVAAGLAGVFAGEAGVDAGDAEAEGGDLGGLVVHECDEGGDDEGCASAGDGGELVAEGFAGAGGHDEQDVRAFGGGAADGFLVGAEGGEAEGGVEQVFEVHACFHSGMDLRLFFVLPGCLAGLSVDCGTTWEWVGVHPRGMLGRWSWRLAVGWLVVGTFGLALGQGLPEAPAAAPVDAKGFWGRWAEFYREDWKGVAASGAAAPRRGLASPLDSPPFPNADWSYGGSPTIGESDGNSYPLMTAVDGAKGRTKVYGWVQPTVNFSTSGESNAPVANDQYSNRFEMNQLVLYVERLPDSVQRDHVDVGYHLTALYGTDYRYTTDKGYLSSQLLVHDRQYGFDPSLEYVDVYVPQVAKGMNIRVGRYISIPGIEAQLSPNNYMFSHSLLYSVDPFTDTGVLATVQVTDQWLVQVGVTAGHDVAPWTSDARNLLKFC
jgi:hypothetical protein